MNTALGNARTLLLGALALAAAVIVGSVALLATQNGGSSSDPDDPAAAGAPSATGRRTHGAGSYGKSGRPSSKKTDDEGDPDDDENGPAGWIDKNREPFGDEGNFIVDESTLRTQIDARKWEEVCRQIAKLDEEGKPI